MNSLFEGLQDFAHTHGIDAVAFETRVGHELYQDDGEALKSTMTSLDSFRAEVKVLDAKSRAVNNAIKVLAATAEEYAASLERASNILISQLAQKKEAEKFGQLARNQSRVFSWLGQYVSALVEESAQSADGDLHQALEAQYREQVRPVKVEYVKPKQEYLFYKVLNPFARPFHSIFLVELSQKV
ncbi:hypothetical protein CYMTET_26093, partial [Cymbomonas tetramitiformis]